MGLILSPRFRRGDLEHWRRREEMDRVYVERCSAHLDRIGTESIATIERFAVDGPCYVSVSWGKDSVVVAHLASRATHPPPIYWFPAGAVENPDNVLVRDAFLSRWPVDYREIVADDLRWDGARHDGGQTAFVRAAREAGDRYISGVRAEESGTRKMTMRVHGAATDRTCRPIGWWTGAEVFAYLARHDLPVHPAYACTMGGTIPRERIRVSTIGGDLGTSHGRAEWERAYYPEIASRRA